MVGLDGFVGIVVQSNPIFLFKSVYIDGWSRFLENFSRPCSLRYLTIPRRFDGS